MQQSTLKNRTIFCKDNLDVLRGINTKSIDLIYLDPPFNSKKVYTAPIGTSSEGASFEDIFKEEDVKDEWLDIIQESNETLRDFLNGIAKVGDKSNKYYLCYMAVRFIEMHRVLKDTGSLYLHCDPTMSHYLKLLLDIVFGEDNFRNEIIWCYTGPSNVTKHFQRKHDSILFYAKSIKSIFNKNAVRVPYKSIGVGKGDSIFKGGDDRDRIGHLLKVGKIPTDWWADDYLTNVSAWRKERTGYPTQKPLAILNRIIKASSNEGDVVLDPFCGCATTCVASEKLGRQWVGIDVSKQAYIEVKKRLKQEIIPELLDPEKEVIYRPKEGEEETDILQRTDLATNKRNKTETKTLLYGEQKGKCKGCKVLFNYRNLAIDHIYPQSKGGGNNIENLQLLCGACNSQKGIGTMAELQAKLKS